MKRLQDTKAVGFISRFKVGTHYPFDLSSTCRNHGWIALPPCQFDPENNTFQRTECLPSGQVIHFTVQQPIRDELEVTTWSASPLSVPEQHSLVEIIRIIFRLDEDLSEFESLCACHPRWLTRVRPGGSRLLRSPTVFEDVVKTICTTNTTWSQTEEMVRRLVRQLGESHPLDLKKRTFPSPEAIVAFGEERLRSEVRMGYRARYIAEIARRIVSKELELEVLRASTLSGTEVRARLRELPGIGPYGAATIGMLLGHYDELAVDSELKKFVSIHYYGGRPITDKEVQEVYLYWGKWKYLAYWFDPGTL